MAAAQTSQSPLLKFTKLTCVHYSPGDTLGKALAHVALAPVLLLVAQAARVHARRDVHEAVALLGLVLEEGLARALKALLQHPRPATCALLHICHSHGMPSSHTSLAFAAAALATATCLAVGRSSRSSSRQQQPAVARLLRLAELAALWLVAGGVAVSRVYLGYHSAPQVAAGALLGVAFGGGWAALMAALAPLYGRVAALPLLRDLGVKDTYVCSDALAVEAAAHAAAAAVKKRA